MWNFCPYFLFIKLHTQSKKKIAYKFDIETNRIDWKMSIVARKEHYVGKFSTEWKWINPNFVNKWLTTATLCIYRIIGNTGLELIASHIQYIWGRCMGVFWGNCGRIGRLGWFICAVISIKCCSFFILLILKITINLLLSIYLF